MKEKKLTIEHDKCYSVINFTFVITYYQVTMAYTLILTFHGNDTRFAYNVFSTFNMHTIYTMHTLNIMHIMYIITMHTMHTPTKLL